MSNILYMLYVCPTVQKYVAKLCFEHIEVETKRPTLCRRHFRMLFLVWNSMHFKQIQLTWPVGWIINIPAKARTMAWCRSGVNPSLEPTMVYTPCVIRPRCVVVAMPGAILIWRVIGNPWTILLASNGFDRLYHISFHFHHLRSSAQYNISPDNG